MGSLLDYYNDPFFRFKGHPFALNPLQKSPAVRTYDWLYDRAHGGNKYALTQVPILGWWRRFRDDIQKAQDYYDITNEDPIYMSKYGGNAGTVSGVAGNIGRVPRMARSLAALYPPEIKESMELRYRAFVASREAADHWKSAWQEYNRRFD